MFLKFGNLRGREIEFNRRLLNSTQDCALGKTGLNQLNDRIVGERRGLFEFKRRAGLGRRADNADSGTARRLRITALPPVAAAAASRIALVTSTGAEDFRLVWISGLVAFLFVSLVLKERIVLPCITGIRAEALLAIQH